LQKHTLLENIIYLLIWIIIFTVPIFGYRQNGDIQWQEVAHFWLRICPFFFLFLINNFLLLPFFLLKKKHVYYLVFIFATICLIFTGIQLLREKHHAADTPHFINNEMPDNHNFQNNDFSHHDFFEPQPPDKMHGQERKMPIRLSPFFMDCLLSILLIGFNIAICFLFKSIRDDRHIKEIESQNLQSELNYLKAQINPHFFMNTLNNIHALVDIDTEKAKKTIIELSKIMRYVLYDSEQPLQPLNKEIEMLNNYVALMHIRYTDEVDIQTVIPDFVPDVNVPPLLLISLIENAFKHGISYEKTSFIHTNLSIIDNFLTYKITNSLISNVPSKKGIGLENLRKRLTLLYKNDYTMETEINSEQYSITLKIPLKK
jgi:hypothetical protein